MGKRILIVDDEEPIRKLLKQILEAEGHTCILAGSAAEARECLKRGPCELVLSDILMPGEPGIDFVREALREYPDMAAIMVTAIDDPFTAEGAIEMGVYGYITKPIERNDVLINVSNALRRRELELANRLYQENLELMVADRTQFLQRLETLFEQLHSPQVAKELMRKIDAPEASEKIREKTEITVLFADIRGFSHMMSIFGLEEVLEFLDEFYGLVAQVVFEQGGSIDKFIGDEVMAFFGAPLAVANPREMGIRTAIEMAASFRELRRRFSREAPQFKDLGIGIGVNSGEVFLGRIGSKNLYDYTVVGSAVELARRLCALAGPDQILTTKNIIQEAPGVVSAEFIRNVSLEGLSGPGNIYAITPP